ncbi:hypothetical protein Kpol_1032p89 [Vanderwaltozyma polyspora DSM 70294]|uniref:Lariat debranching enzyme C-terminal domain-containing protein n=1 Tax=Vanderwaltozyma polyspora (strain ATCC 22028 / DSM 70294 / BCRC 21397 / CBS 2163 / NBRC 10782 / NRRL Y-8283 / UCD 57-17) TaxID=436907 RepID=A7TH40_VANPO|nr:uncharacterized protein Kpol_1032p89 [Vanderwaltozyma polyspora DSM 70294]EDO18492.1 hypothetical protein Kpol_1032p89 [Vanderwaltozyma polyspora DSM 70294]
MAKLRIAVQGCCHGELNLIFKKVKELNDENPIDLLIILGDFQSLRSEEDFKSISMPDKYKKLGDFSHYYNDEIEDHGLIRPPVPTLFIGGNHESMRHLMLLSYGGYAAENIYYLGYSNVIWFKGIRIGSLSGIWKPWGVDKTRPSWDELETRDLWRETIRDLYHVNKQDLAPLFLLKNGTSAANSNTLDIMLSHDWPNGIVYHGNYYELLRKKPFFENDIKSRRLGSPISWQLLRNIKPKWWFSAHLHVKYEASVKHTKRKISGKPTKTKNKDEIELDLSSSEEDDNDEEEEEKDIVTNFMALDKCLPRRQHLEIVEIETNTNHQSYIDSGSMYWDPEFIKNLQYINKNQDKLNKTPFKEINWNELIKDSNIGLPPNDGNATNSIDWSLYKVPSYTKGIQKRESEQTQWFIDRHINNC